MRQHDMKHLGWLRHVAAADVAHLEMKEKTYQGSWKRAGGRSAWFMLRRKIDRLLEMMRRPEPPHGFTIEDMLDCVSDNRPTDEVTIDKSVAEFLTVSYMAENIFAMIRKDPTGKDGSVLAEVRDLRRYLLLVEAEMVSRGAIEEPEIKDGSNTELYSRVFNATTAERTVPRYSDSDALAGEATAPRPRQPSREDPTIQEVHSVRGVVEGNLTDAEREAFRGLSPWLLLKTEWRAASDHEGERVSLNVLYDEHGAGLMKLTPDLSEAQRFQLAMVVNSNASVASNLIKEALKCYVEVRGAKLHVLDVSRAPTDYRSAWPHFHGEYNAHELASVENWQRKLYFYDEAGTKWKIKPGFEAWLRESL